MKRSYLLVYALVIMSLIFMVVIKITDNNLEQSKINTIYIDNLKKKYEYESAAHLFISKLTNEDIDELKQKLKNDSFSIKIPLTNEIDNIKNAKVSLKDENLLIEIGKNDGIYKAEIKIAEIKQPNNLIEIIKDDFSKENLLDLINEDFVSIDDVSIETKKSDNDIFVLSKYNSISNIESQLTHESDKKVIENNSVDDELNLKDTSDEIKEINNSEKGKQEDNSSKTDNIDDNSKDIVHPDLEKTTEEEREKNKSEDKEIESSEKSDLEISVNENYIFGPNVNFSSKQSIKTKGLLFIDENTVIDAPLYSHTGLIIMSGHPKIIKGEIEFRGKIINNTDIKLDYLTYTEDDNYVFEMLNINKFSTDYKIESFVIR